MERRPKGTLLPVGLHVFSKHLTIYDLFKGVRLWKRVVKIAVRGRLHWYSELFLWEGAKRRCKAVPEARCDLDEHIHYTETLQHRIGAEMFFSPCLLRHNVFSYLPSECLFSPCLISWGMCLLWPLESGGEKHVETGCTWLNAPYIYSSYHRSELDINLTGFIWLSPVTFHWEAVFSPTQLYVLSLSQRYLTMKKDQKREKTKSTTLKKQYSQKSDLFQSLNKK